MGIFRNDDDAGQGPGGSDPTTGSKRAVFDRDRLAAEITRITGDPYEARHLPIRSIRFIDGNTLDFPPDGNVTSKLSTATPSSFSPTATYVTSNLSTSPPTATH